MASKHGNSHGSSQHHVTPFKVYLNVALSLFALTFLTIVAHHFKALLGPMAPVVAFLIATVKAVLVMLWFMHLKHEGNLNRVIFGSGFFFLFLLYFFSELDILTRVFQGSTL